MSSDDQVAPKKLTTKRQRLFQYEYRAFGKFPGHFPDVSRKNSKNIGGISGQILPTSDFMTPIRDQTLITLMIIRGICLDHMLLRLRCILLFWDAFCSMVCF